MYTKGYFKGWYFKCCTDNGKTVAFIPAYHYNNGKKTASLQVITDTKAFYFPFDSLNYRNNPLSMQIGNCRFGEKGLSLHLKTKKNELQGSLRFGPLSPIRYDIMGPFAFLPFMQCKHQVFSMIHRINGRCTINGESFDFHNGSGYIEGDRGHTFPKRYIWTQCCFENGSLMISAADIPWLGLRFTGIIGIVLLNGKEYRLATYLGARIKRIGDHTFVVKQGYYEFTAKLLQENKQPLWAPAKGNMVRIIHESASCRAYYRFSYKNTVLCEFVSNRAGFEFEYPSR